MHAFGNMWSTVKGSDATPRVASNKQLPAGAPAAPQAAQEGPPLPPAFFEAMAGVMKAPDDKARVMALLEALKVMYADENYRAVPVKIMTQVEMGMKDQFVRSITMLMTDCVSMDIIDQKTADAVISVAGNRFEDVRKMLRGAKEEAAKEKTNGPEAEDEETEDE
jgi:hypothetical protein